MFELARGIAQLTDWSFCAIISGSSKKVNIFLLNLVGILLLFSGLGMVHP